MKRFVLPLILLWYFIISFWNIKSLPSDWFGDISIEHEFVTRILHGEFPWQFDLSAGPFYHYIITPIIAVVGQSYLGYKIASVIFGSLGIIGIYYCGYILGGITLAWTSAFIASSSFWYLVWVRLGSSPQLATPVIFVWALYFLFRFERYKHFKDCIIALLISGFGLLTYPASFLYPLIIWINIVILSYPFKLRLTVRRLTVITLITMSMYFLFGVVVKEQLSEFTSGYVRNKIPSAQQVLTLEFIHNLFSNFTTTIGMFFTKGDEIFRTNVPLSPHIDRISAICMICGMVFFIFRKQWKIFIAFGVSLIILLLPSSLPSNPFREVPNIGRTLCVVPIIFICIGQGIQFLYLSIARFSKHIAVISTLIIMGAIVLANIYKYFIVYPTNLPNNNQPYGLYIARYIDSLPQDTIVQLTSCCWGTWGQPEPKAIVYQLRVQNGRQSLINNPFTTSCESLLFYSTLFIFDPNDQQIIDQFSACYPDGVLEYHHDLYGNSVFASMLIRR